MVAGPHHLRTQPPPPVSHIGMVMSPAFCELLATALLLATFTYALSYWYFSHQSSSSLNELSRSDPDSDLELHMIITSTLPHDRTSLTRAVPAGPSSIQQALDSVQPPGHLPSSTHPRADVVFVDAFFYTFWMDRHSLDLSHPRHASCMLLLSPPVSRWCTCLLQKTCAG